MFRYLKNNKSSIVEKQWPSRILKWKVLEIKKN